MTSRAIRKSTCKRSCSPTRALCEALAASGLLGALACNPVDTQVGAEIPAVPVYIEAEDGTLAGGFSVETDPLASGGRFIAPPDGLSVDAPGSATATYSFRTLAAHGTYVIWGRIHGPSAFPYNSFWVSVDGAASTQWRLSTGVIWWWGPVTRGTEYGVAIVYSLDAGPHQIVVRNSAPGVGLDRIYIQAAPGHAPPGNNSACPLDPPNEIELEDGGCSPSCGSQLGTMCGSQTCAGFVQLPSYDCTVCCRILDSGTENDAGEAGP
jgi:hypothetical protein